MSDTIAAIATGGIVSAIGIIRISGANAIGAAGAVFRPASGISLAETANRRMYYGELIDADGGLVDLCMCVVVRGPNSYTGEDTVEFHCHGSPVVLAEGLRALFAQGVRQALAGEFTKRAFLNGRMDLTQAEAVIDLIEAESPVTAKNAAGQLQGAIGAALGAVYEALVDVMSHFHAAIDYPDEDIDAFEMANYRSILSNARNSLEAMLATHERGKVMRDGVPTAIVGRPNTGKSSLLNALLGYDRAIVTHIPGTTRDTVEEKILAGGVLLRLIDTAGLRKTDDLLEQLGADRSLAAIKGAGLILPVLDGSEPLRDEDRYVLSLLPADVPKLAVINKSDLPQLLHQEALDALGFGYCHVCSLSGGGLGALTAMIGRLFPELGKPPSGEVITNARQAEAIVRALGSITFAVGAIDDSVTADAVLTEVEAALDAIGGITGKNMKEDIITRIFERFCVGK